jgi:hypothetical protein
VDAVTHAVDPGVPLRIDVEELSRNGMLVSLRGIERLLESPDAPHALELQVLRDGRYRDTHFLGDFPTRMTAATELDHSSNQSTGRSIWERLGTTTPILEPLLTLFFGKRSVIPMFRFSV